MNKTNAQNDPELVVDACWKRIGVFGDKSCPELPHNIRCLNCETFHATAAKLLDRRAPAGYQAFWAKRAAKPRSGELAGTRSVVVFRIGAEWFALPTQSFLEVAENRPIHSLPHRKDPLVQGLTVIRGELLICISLPSLLGFDTAKDPAASAPKGREHGSYERLLVLGRDGERVVFAADEVHVGVRYHPDSLKPLPATVSRSACTYTVGLLEWQHCQVGVLDEALVFYTLGRQLS